MTGRDARPVAVGERQHHPLRADSTDLAGDVAAQIEAGGDRAVGIAEKDDVVDADDLRGRALLGLAQDGHLLARRVVETAGVAVRGDAVGDLDAGGRPAGDGARRPEVDVVRVRGEDQHAIYFGVC